MVASLRYGQFWRNCPLRMRCINSMPATVVAAFLKRLKLGIAFVLDFTLRWSCLIRLLRH